MGDIPLDARRVVDDLRAARKVAGTDAPSSWVPSDSFESTLQNTIQPPVHLNPHLHWMHENWDLRSLLAPPPARGVKGLVKRVTHRLVMVVLGPYLDRLQDYVGVTETSRFGRSVAIRAMSAAVSDPIPAPPGRPAMASRIVPPTR